MVVYSTMRFVFKATNEPKKQTLLSDNFGQMHVPVIP